MRPDRVCPAMRPLTTTSPPCPTSRLAGARAAGRDSPRAQYESMDVIARDHIGRRPRARYRAGAGRRPADPCICRVAFRRCMPERVRLRRGAAPGWRGPRRHEGRAAKEAVPPHRPCQQRKRPCHYRGRATGAAQPLTLRPSKPEDGHNCIDRCRHASHGSCQREGCGRSHLRLKWQGLWQ